MNEITACLWSLKVTLGKAILPLYTRCVEAHQNADNVSLLDRFINHFLIFEIICVSGEEGIIIIIIFFWSLPFPLPQYFEIKDVHKEVVEDLNLKKIRLNLPSK